jgi:hypothetical protein
MGGVIPQCGVWVVRGVGTMWFFGGVLCDGGWFVVS